MSSGEGYTRRQHLMPQDLYGLQPGYGYVWAAGLSNAIPAYFPAGPLPASAAAGPARSPAKIRTRSAAVTRATSESGIPAPLTVGSVPVIDRPRLVFAVDATSSRSAAWNAALRLTDALLAALPGELDGSSTSATSSAASCRCVFPELALAWPLAFPSERPKRLCCPARL